MSRTLNLQLVCTKKPFLTYIAFQRQPFHFTHTDHGYHYHTMTVSSKSPSGDELQAWQTRDILSAFDNHQIIPRITRGLGY